MNKLLPLLGILFTATTQASVVLEEKPRVYKFECAYSTPLFREGEHILVIVKGEVNSLEELKGKQEVVVTGDGKVETLSVGNCTVEL